MACLFLLVIRFSLHVPCDVFTITNEDNHVETDQTNLANDQLAKQNASGIHDIFYPKYNSKLEGILASKTIGAIIMMIMLIIIK